MISKPRHAESAGGSQGNFSTLENILSVCHVFQLTTGAAQDTIDQQVATIRQHWVATCEAAGMGDMERKRLWQRAVFNPFCFGA